MADRCASLDATWAHVLAPAPAAWGHHPSWLSPVGAAFEDDALTAALWASMSPPAGAVAVPAAASSSSYCSASPTPSSSATTSSASAEVLAGSSARPGGGPAPRAARTGPTGRVSKRKPRPSRRARTTYISADPADFRRMVQEITGFPVPGADTALAVAASSSPAARPATAPTCVLPTLDTSAFLVEYHASPPPPQSQPERKSMPTGLSPAAADEASSLLQELEAMVSAPPYAASAFPTLESWGMM